MPLVRFTVLTLTGCLIWCFAFAGVGWGLGASWRSFHQGFRFVDYAVVALVVMAVAYLVMRLVRTSRSEA